jgi:hypothetical protein
MYETEDWRLFTDLATLPQKAGCHPAYLGEIVLKELTDNGFDNGGTVSLDMPRILGSYLTTAPVLTRAKCHSCSASTDRCSAPN